MNAKKGESTQGFKPLTRKVKKALWMVCSFIPQQKTAQQSSAYGVYLVYYYQSTTQKCYNKHKIENEFRTQKTCR